MDKKIKVYSKRLCLVPRDIQEQAALICAEKDDEMRQAYTEMLETMKKSEGHEEYGAEWKIMLREGGTVIGGLCFKGLPDASGEVEIGYGINEEFRRMGYATEAVGAVLGWAFGQAGVICVTAQTEPDNDISKRVLLSSGFVRDGYGDEGPMYKIRKKDYIGREHHKYTFRTATPSDAARLLAIYAEFIDSFVTFEEVLPTEAEFEARICEILRFYPYIVCECDGEIVGYTYSHLFRTRSAYRFSAETSVYIEKSHTGRGIGKALYGALAEISSLQNIHALYGGVSFPNAASEALHLSAGFKFTGADHECGYKCGGWRTVHWYEKLLADSVPVPCEPVPFASLDGALVEEIYRKYASAL